jgi:Carboxypeptidase regulatory-like domain
MFRLFSFSARAVICGLFVLFTCVSASAQFKAGIQGTVSDSTGALVPEAKITLQNTETSKTQEITSSAEGFYRFSGLPPGKYSLTAEKTGFNKQILENLVIGAETVQGLDIVLTAGQVSESVTVTTETMQTLQTESANVDRTLTTLEVRQLPQNGRDPYELLRLTPGIFGDGARAGNGNAVNLPNTTGPGGSSNSIFQTENQVPISANGQRLSNNNFQIDGVSVNSLNWGGAAIVTPNQEAVKEISVLSSTYSAEDGRNSGAQIKVVSQNGTNDFHGSAFFKYNSPKFNAFNKFGGPGARPVRVNDYIRQFGGSLGGPVYLPRFGEGGPTTISGKNKAFFFFSYEGLRNNSSNTGQAYVETAQYRQLVQQLRPNSIAAKIFSSSGIEPRIISVLNPGCVAFNNNDPTLCRVVGGGLDIGSPTGAQGQYVDIDQKTGGGFDGIPDLQQVQFALPARNQGNQYNLRFDFTPSEKNSFTFTTFLTRLDNLGSDSAAQGRPIADLPFKPKNSSGTILFTHVFSPTLLNEARFNVSRFFIDQVADASAAGVNFAIPRVEVENLPIGDRIRFGAGQGDGTPAKFAQNTFEFSDTLTKTRGNHAFRFGGAYRKEQDNSDLTTGATRPLYSINQLWNVANDTPIFEAILADPRTGGQVANHPYFRTTYFAGFVQDDWKTRPNLTLNLGLRYEYYSPLMEKFDRLSNLFLGSQGLTDAQVRVVDKFYKSDRNNFAPRIGFAYSPRIEGFGDFFNGQRAVIRGGFGIAYNRIPVAPLNNARANPPFVSRNGICCGTATTDFGSPFAGGRILYAVGSSNSPLSYPINSALATGINPATGAPNVTDSSIEIYGSPQDLPNPYVYTYSLETQLELPAALVATIGYQGSAGHKLIRLVNQRFLFPVTSTNPYSAVYFTTPDVNSNYNALNASLARRLSKGLQMQANYRFSKSIDQLSYEGPGAVTNQTFPQDNRTERGPSDFDVKHYFNLAGLYELPFFNGRNDFVGKALGGFSISGILTARTGFPFTPVIGNDISTPGGPKLNPTRPQGYSGPSSLPTSNDAFISGIFGPNGRTLFTLIPGNPPGIGRNSFRGPKYFDIDMSLVKQVRLNGLLGLAEGTNFEFRANFFNIFNQLNLGSFNFNSNSTRIDNADFGKPTTGLAGRVVELQGRFRF